MDHVVMAIYQYEYRLDRQKELLAQESPENADIIEKFIRDQRIKSEISDSRVYILYGQMRLISRIMKDKLQNPSEEDIKNLVEQINNHKVIKGNRKPKEATDVTKRNIKATARQFFRWMNDDTPPKYLKLIKTNNKLSRQKEKEIISPETHQKLLDACENARDKAILSALYDSGVRAGELLERRIKDLEFEDYGLVLRVRSGKTGYRQVVVVGESPIYLRQWLDVHPDKNNLNAFLFVKINRNGEPGPLDYNALRQIFQRTKERAGIKERIHPHLYRHTRASLLASSVAEAPLEAQMGWVHGSKMSATYVHLSGEAQKSAILKAYGLKKEDTIIPAKKAIKCNRCQQDNLSDAKYCRYCWLPLDAGEALKMKEREEEVSKAILELLPEQMRNIYLNLPPGQARSDMLTLMLLQKEKSGGLDEIKKKVRNPKDEK
jgi:integrase